MPPIEVRQSASRYATKHSNGNDALKLLLVEAFIEGYYTRIEEPQQPFIVDDTIVAPDAPQPISALLEPAIPFFEPQANLPSFEDFWREYDYKKAKPQALKMWKKLTLVQQVEIMESLPAYIASTPDKSFRMHPATYINPNNERWKDEIVIKPKPTYGNKEQSRLDNYAKIIANTTGEGY